MKRTIDPLVLADKLRQDAFWLLANTSTETNEMVSRILTAAKVIEHIYGEEA